MAVPLVIAAPSIPQHCALPHMDAGPLGFSSDATLAVINPHNCCEPYKPQPNASIRQCFACCQMASGISSRVMREIQLPSCSVSLKSFAVAVVSICDAVLALIGI